MEAFRALPSVDRLLGAPAGAALVAAHGRQAATEALRTISQTARAALSDVRLLLTQLRHREAEGSSYYRHFYMGLIREDGTPKPSLDVYARHAADMGLMQWFHFEDPRLDDAVVWMKRLGVRHLRTGLSWADSFRPGAMDWFDRQMEALAPFDTTVTFCFTPEHRGVEPHHTSPPQVAEEYAQFCADMVSRYAPRRAAPTLPVEVSEEAA